MSITERQQKVLYNVIKTYIETAEPVGSKILHANFFKDLSSATIRNDLAALEENGYLMHMHTSSGRVPTEKGYMHYIDKLMKVYAMTKKEKSIIDHLSRSLETDMHNVMDRTLGVMTSMFNTLSICQSNFDGDLMLQLKDKMQNDHFHNGVKVRGLNKIINEPEFGKTEQLRSILEVVDNDQKLTEVFTNNTSDSVNVRIGRDVGVKELEKCAVITKSITYQDQPVMSLGLIAPMRMRYSKAISVIDEISQIIDRTLEEVL